MRLTATFAGIALALVVLGSTGAAPLGFLGTTPSVRPGLGTRQALELLVMGLQVAGVLALAWTTLSPESGQAAWTLMGIQVGLGVDGALCAGFESGFALYAGTTLVVLMLGAMLQAEGASHGARSGSSVLNG